MKSIRSFLIVLIGCLVLAVCVLAISIAYAFARSTAMEIIHDNLASLANSVSSYIASEIDKEMAVLQSLAISDAITSPELTLWEKVQFLVPYKELDASRFDYCVIDARGDGVATSGASLNIASRDYFQQAMQGKSVVTDALEDIIRPGVMTFFYVVPIRDRETREIVGAVTLKKDAQQLSELLAGIPIGHSGGPYVISNVTGDTVAHYSSVATIGENMEQRAAADSSLREVASFNAAMRTGMQGVGQYSYFGTTYISAYAPLPSEYCDWSVACNAPIGEFTGGIAMMLRVMIIVALVLCAAGIAVAVFIATSIAKPISVVCDGIECTAKDGDLTVRLEERGSGEIAAISSSFNRFIGLLHEIISDMSDSTASMQEIANGLTNSVTAISSDISTIARDIENLNFAADEQSSSVGATSSTITQIAHNIESLANQIESQSTAVTQSSAAVQEMAANISSISENVDKASGSFDELKRSAADGKGSINAVQELVSKLSAQSDSLLEANSVIDNIASQTNLLAMNAAIEAAHAGEAGKGFSVVAEEIRKLAESSASQSKTIAAGLKSTIAAINNIAQATTTAGSAFDSVASKISAVTELVSTIAFAMTEQNAGSRQVLDALRDIEDVTAQIRNGAVEMNAGTGTILKEMSRLSSVSQQMQERSASIAKAAETIDGSLEGIVSRSGSNSEAIDVLVGITGKFRL